MQQTMDAEKIYLHIKTDVVLEASVMISQSCTIKMVWMLVLFCNLLTGKVKTCGDAYSNQASITTFVADGTKDCYSQQLRI